ncbi:MAG: hypothetical protein IT377_09675 [Polyangiaceae bacterium]|jgi:hypothetical protein|nr:hypothetical protein [Polyangiaceae bacterium]
MDEALPRPDRIRTLEGGRVGWIASEALRDGWLRVVSHRTTAVYALLCLAADARGVSRYGTAALGLELGLEDGEVRLALARLEQLQLVASRAELRQVLRLPDGGPQRPRVPSFGGK